MLRRAAFVLASLMLLSACGSGGTTGPPGARTVVVLPSDAGHTISLHVGDRLLVELAGPPQATWMLAAYPREALAVTSSAPTDGRFEFTAQGSGTGQVLIVMRVPSGAVPGGNDFPLRPFRVTIQVS